MTMGATYTDSVDRATAIATKISLLLSVCFAFITPVRGLTNAPNSTTQALTPTDFLNGLLDKRHYDSHMRPNFNGMPTNVTINMFVAHMEINHLTMELNMDMYLRQTWMDKRLAHIYPKPLVLHQWDNFVQRIWIADLFFSNEKKSQRHDATVPNRYIRVAGDGKVLFSERWSSTFWCHAVLKSFPLDTQVCSIQLESYGYSTEDVIFHWAPEAPVQIAQDIDLPHFKLMDTKTSVCTKVYSTGAFTCLQVSFTLARVLGFYLCKTYLPSSLVVYLSWISFWLKSDAITARILIGVGTILPITYQLATLQDSVPPSSYTKAIDVWMLACVIFIFSALLEYVLVCCCCCCFRCCLIKRPLSQDHEGNDTDEMESTLQTEPKSGRKCFKVLCKKLDARHVDLFSRVLFPISFFLFAIGYWYNFHSSK